MEVAEVIFEVAEAKFWISSSFYKFSFRIFVVLDFEVIDLSDLGVLRMVSVNFLKKFVFEISEFQGKR